MATEFFYRLMGEVIGPVTGVELRHKALDGDVTPDTPVRVGADGEWVSASRLSNLFDEQHRPIPFSASPASEPARHEGESTAAPSPPKKQAATTTAGVIRRTKVTRRPFGRGTHGGWTLVGLMLIVLAVAQHFACCEWDDKVGGPSTRRIVLFVLARDCFGESPGKYDTRRACLWGLLLPGLMICGGAALMWPDWFRWRP